LSAAIDHSLEDSPLGAFIDPERPGREALPELDKSENELVDPLARAMGSNPKKASELESLLRGAIEKDLKDVAKELSGDAGSTAPPEGDPKAG
ncbi:MAG TPA: hypothetical protein VLS89_01265, partial [Candidatus Nanopelagicales bacterium]|nr:hypothetical protein [Candidatus Nanopelagicales bacterium]